MVILLIMVPPEKEDLKNYEKWSICLKTIDEQTLNIYVYIQMNHINFLPFEVG